jgi:hypothetical protein
MQKSLNILIIAALLIIAVLQALTYFKINRAGEELKYLSDSREKEYIAAGEILDKINGRLEKLERQTNKKLLLLLCLFLSAFALAKRPTRNFGKVKG